MIQTHSSVTFSFKPITVIVKKINNSDNDKSNNNNNNYNNSDENKDKDNDNVR